MTDSVSVSAAEFDTLFDGVSNWARWDVESPRGALNHLTPGRMVAAARLVRSGITVGLGLPWLRVRAVPWLEPGDHVLPDELLNPIAVF